MLLDGRPQSTIRAYTRSVRDLMEGVGKVPLDCTDEEVIGHIGKYRDEHDLGSSTVNARICGLRYLYHRVYKENGRKLVIPNPRRIKQIGEVLTESEINLLLAACHYPRQAAILHLLYDTGLRAREVAHLRLQDFDKANGVLYVRYGKGGKHRVVPYGLAVTEVLKTYFLIEKPTDWLFEGSTKGEPASVKSIQYAVREAHKRAPIRKAVHPHTLRHTFAVHYLNNGGSIVRLQQLLGHSELGSTLIYLKYAAIPLRETDTPLDVLRGRHRERK
jgi:site-specific recombinase XerD